MIIKQSNLLSALTHLRAALSTLAPEEELNGEQMYIREQLEEVETLLVEGLTNEANEPEGTCTAIKWGGKDDGVYLESEAVGVEPFFVDSSLLINLSYRYLDDLFADEQFQIFYNDEWLYAQSVDFEFND